ncbi:MAG: hypothetical protein K0R17_2846 [Rariglobus sp.]|jgi:hypothetical protein|nr:hypothetical protein [Rariglobus sp.]
MLTAWLLATGSHWDLVQTFAWGRMIATYSQSMSLSQAVKLTFTSDNLCGICESVSEAKQQQDAALPSEGKALGKIQLVYQPAPTFHLAPSAAGTWRLRDLVPADGEPSPPPVRPPWVLV